MIVAIIAKIDGTSGERIASNGVTDTGGKIAIGESGEPNEMKIKILPWLYRALIHPTRQPTALVDAREQIKKKLCQIHDECEVRRARAEMSNRNLDQRQVKIGR